MHIHTYASTDNFTPVAVRAAMPSPSAVTSPNDPLVRRSRALRSSTYLEMLRRLVQITSRPMVSITKANTNSLVEPYAFELFVADCTIII